MELLHIFAEEGLDPTFPRKVRHAARGIIWREGKLALIKSERYGDYKFLGGGLEPGETPEEALLREAREEGGLVLDPAAIRPYGETVELRRDTTEAAVFEQHSYYFFCEAGAQVTEPCLDDYEAAYGYRLVWAAPGEALAANAALLASETITPPPWTRRDSWVLARLCESFPVKEPLL